MKRISKDSYYLEIAEAVSHRSTCLKRRYGAVIVKNDEIIATGYNGSVRGAANCCDVGSCKRLAAPSNTGDYSDCHSVHAEQNALLSASRGEMIGATMYLYGDRGRASYGKGDEIMDVMWEPLESPEPCPICRRMIANAGIIRVVTLENRSDD